MNRIALAAFSALTLCAPGLARAWTQSYVVEWFEPAFYYGGPTNGGSETAGADCPRGLNAMDWRKVLLAPYRSAAKVNEINNAEYGRQNFLGHLGFRGPNKENIYENPTAIADVGLIEVGGDKAEGFDLDGDPSTGFVGLDGAPGVDNAYYKATGCVAFFRGRPRDSLAFKYSNDGMHDGVYTTVFVFSGNGPDPRNDPEVTIGVYAAKDKVVKDAFGQVARDYSYRVNPAAQYQTVIKAASRDGVIATKAAGTVRMRDFWAPDFFPTELVLEKAQIRLEMNKDGTVTGLLGGYRNWHEHYRGVAGMGRTGTAAIHENLGHFSMSGWYYALRRNADGPPDANGARATISTTYRLTLIPGFVMTPEGDRSLSVAQAVAP